MWFKELFGFREDEVNAVAEQFVLDQNRLTSLANGRMMQWGTFETPLLSELRERGSASPRSPGVLRVREVVANAQDLHLNRENAGAAFQVASQFNTLEMVSPSITPEDGIERYENDRTQGPACAVACAAGTIYRNYLVDVDGQRGQTARHQIDCLGDLARALSIDIEMCNGYAFPTAVQLDQVGDRLFGCTENDREQLLAQLRVGLQSDTEVTLLGGGHSVTQIYCSALPVAYSSVPAESWEPFARLVLDAAYEATFAAAAINTIATGNNRLFLTMLGGGAFGNQPSWILDAIDRSLRLYADFDLDVGIVSHGRSNSDLHKLLGNR